LYWRSWEDAEEELVDRMVGKELKGEIDRLVVEEADKVESRGWSSEP
jgi:hypothetical protein